MLLLPLLIFSAIAQALNLPIRPVAIDDRDNNITLHHPQLSVPPFPPYRPPPEPWEEHTCRDLGAFPNFYLTFSWGTIISRAALGGLLNASKRTLRLIIQDGHGDEYLPLYIGSVIVPYLGLVLVARPYKDAHFTYNQISDAIALLQHCGFDRGNRDEMWAYVFDHRNRVGEISIQMERIPVSDRNTTSTLEAA